MRPKDAPKYLTVAVTDPRENPSLTKLYMLAQKEFLLLSPSRFRRRRQSDYKALSQVYEHTYPACKSVMQPIVFGRFCLLKRTRKFISSQTPFSNTEETLHKRRAGQNFLPENLILYRFGMIRRKTLVKSPPSSNKFFINA